MTLLEYTKEKELAQARKDMAKYRDRINADPEKRAEYLEKKKKEWKNMSPEAKEKKNQKEREEYEDLKHHDVDEYNRMLASTRKAHKNRNEKSKRSADNHYEPWKDKKAKKKVVGHEKKDSDIAKELGRTVFAIGDKRKELKESNMGVLDKIDKYLNKENMLNEVDDSNEAEFGYRSRKKNNAYLRYLIMLGKKAKVDPIKEKRDIENLTRYINEPILKESGEDDWQDLKWRTIQAKPKRPRFVDKKEEGDIESEPAEDKWYVESNYSGGKKGEADTSYSVFNVARQKNYRYSTKAEAIKAAKELNKKIKR